MKFITVLLMSLFSIASFSFSSPPTNQAIVAFQIRKGFSDVDGQFGKVDYSIILHKDGSGIIKGTANVSSIASGIATRDRHLQNEEWFDAANHPQIAIQSQKIVKQQEGVYLGTFEIKIKGKSKTMDFPFHVITKEGTKYLKAAFSLSLDAFGVGGGVVDLLVGDKATINLILPF